MAKAQETGKHRRIWYWVAGIAALCIAGIWGLNALLNLPQGARLPSVGQAQAENGPYLFSVERDGKWGYMDETGAIRIAPEYEYAKVFRFGLGVAKRNGYYGLLGAEGPITEFEFDQLGELSNDRVLAAYGAQYGYLNEKGELAIEPIYDAASDFRDGLAAVCVQGQWGYVDVEGNLRIGMQYASATDFGDGLAAVWKEGNGYLLIDRNGRIKARLSLIPGGAFSCGRMLVANGEDKLGYIDTKGKTVIEPIYDGADSFYEDLVAVQSDGAWGYIDREGNWVVEPAFDDAWRFSEGYAPVLVDGLWGYIDREGNWAIEPQFEEAYLFTNGLAPVVLDGVYRYVRPDGAFVDPNWPE